MCLLVPGKIVEINGDEATVDYEVEERKGRLLEKGYEVGDFVLIQGGIVVQKVAKEEAERALESYKKAMN